MGVQREDLTLLRTSYLKKGEELCRTLSNHLQKLVFPCLTPPRANQTPRTTPESASQPHRARFCQPVNHPAAPQLWEAVSALLAATESSQFHLCSHSQTHFPFFCSLPKIPEMETCQDQEEQRQEKRHHHSCHIWSEMVKRFHEFTYDQ